MARRATKTIPTAFIKLDTNVTTTDEYINVRDLQVARANHNMLLARGLRRTVLAMSFSDEFPNRATWLVRRGNIGDERFGAQSPIVQAWVRLGDPVQSVVGVIDGTVIGTGLDVEFLLVVERPMGLRSFDASGTGTASHTGGATKTSITAPVPFVSEDGRGERFYRVSLFMQPEIGGNLVSGVTIGAVGSNGESVTAATASLPATRAAGEIEGYVLHFSDTTIPPRVCSRSTISGGNTIMEVAKPFGPLPVAGSDTLSVDEVAIFEPLAFTVYESHVTSFDANRAGI